MVENPSEQSILADLQTAQNRMFPFVSESMQRFEQEGRVAMLMEDQGRLADLSEMVRQQLFELLNISDEKKSAWHMGITDSGKRTIEILVDSLCPAVSGKNALVDTENYVGFNKFSAATTLEKRKGVAFEKPFNVELGHALTVNSDIEFDKLTRMFQENRFDILWVCWNSTSTGIHEDMGEIVRRRNAAKSKTIIIADAASKHLFSNEWQSAATDHLPDVFFFSLRKQGLPYEGPNDEIHQARNSGALVVFNNNAIQWARCVDVSGLYDSPSLSGYAEGQITQGEQRINHIKHLLKLNGAFDYFLSGEKERISGLEASRKAVREKIMAALPRNGGHSPSEFSLFSDPDAQSESAYILKVPEDTSAKKVIARLKEKGILVSMCMHPKMDGRKYVRFAFYPGNRAEEVDCLLLQLSIMDRHRAVR